MQSDEYQAMQAGVAPAGCRCIMTSPERMDTYDGPQPAEWEQADDCPVHPLTSAPIMLNVTEDDIRVALQRNLDAITGDDMASKAARRSLMAVAQTIGYEPVPTAPGSAQEPVDPTASYSADLREDLANALQGGGVTAAEADELIREYDEAMWYLFVKRGQS